MLGNPDAWFVRTVECRHAAETEPSAPHGITAVRAVRVRVVQGGSWHINARSSWQLGIRHAGGEALGCDLGPSTQVVNDLGHPNHGEVGSKAPLYVFFLIGFQASKP